MSGIAYQLSIPRLECWHAPEATGQANQIIQRQLLRLETAPGIGSPHSEDPELRELVIAFGRSGQVALHHPQLADGTVYVLVSSTQKEAGLLMIEIRKDSGSVHADFGNLGAAAA